ncbi:hypothetical protein Leryth_016281 [Lithospermum erythrorhizon]|nr:hypothetical protein Leryth_016281 [Lithospermum erythrorhizon]
MEVSRLINKPYLKKENLLYRSTRNSYSSQPYNVPGVLFPNVAIASYSGFYQEDDAVTFSTDSNTLMIQYYNKVFSRTPFFASLDLQRSALGNVKISCNYCSFSASLDERMTVRKKQHQDQQDKAIHGLLAK